MMHIPVMLNEVIEYLKPKQGETYLDCTFGAGGYSSEILKYGANVVAIDRDPSVQIYADQLLQRYPENFCFINTNFSSLSYEYFNRKFDGIVLDLGISSMQVDQADRGFSFMRDGILDMRMNPNDERNASDFVNNESEEEMANIIFSYGEERDSRRIARAICDFRAKNIISSTSELADIVRGAVRSKSKKIDTATKTFQAIRIWVNNELNEIQFFLHSAKNMLNIGGRLIIVTFHSLEDAIAKIYMRSNSYKRRAISKYAAQPPDMGDAVYILPVTKAVKPSDEEVRRNPRSRSAKLRVAVKI